MSLQFRSRFEPIKIKQVSEFCIIELNCDSGGCLGILGVTRVFLQKLPPSQTFLSPKLKHNSFHHMTCLPVQCFMLRLNLHRQDNQPDTHTHTFRYLHSLHFTHLPTTWSHNVISKGEHTHTHTHTGWCARVDTVFIVTWQFVNIYIFLRRTDAILFDELQKYLSKYKFTVFERSLLYFWAEFESKSSGFELRRKMWMIRVFLIEKSWDAASKLTPVVDGFNDAVGDNFICSY